MFDLSNETLLKRIEDLELKLAQHTHDGINSQQINPNNLLGFPVVLVADATVAPTDAPLNGTVRFLYDATPDYRIWVYINGDWTVATLT